MSSKTDIDVFQNMANPEKIDSANISADDLLQSIEEVHDIESPPPQMSSPPPATQQFDFSGSLVSDASVLENAVQQQRTLPQKIKVEAPVLGQVPVMPVQQASPESTLLTPPRRVTPPSPPRMSDEDVMMEKQATLLEIDRLRSQGFNISKNFTMDDSLEAMQFEVRRHLIHAEETRMVGMMEHGFQLAMVGIEMGAKKFNLLDLEGWSSEVTADMSKFTPALSKLYRKYYRNQTWSPEQELLFAIGSSACMFHLQKKFFKFPSGTGSKPGATPSANPFANFPFGGFPSAPAPASQNDDGFEESPPPL